MGSALGRALAIRCAEAALSIAMLVTMTFFLAHVAPGGPAYAILGLRPHPASVTAVDLQLGLNVPIWRQYAAWWAHVLHGSLGTSFLLNRPVAAILGEYTATSAGLLAAGFCGGLVLSLAGGLLHGLYYRAWLGRLLGAVELGLYATPGFVLGTVLALLCAGFMPAGGAADVRLEHPGWADWLRHLALPAATMALVVYAGLARFFAASVDATLAEPLTRTARARGLGPGAVVWRHVVPNAARPLITVLGTSLPGLVASAVVVESLFAYPGLGWLLWRSAVAQDYPVLVGVTLVIGIMTVVGTLVADLVSVLIDPRLRNE